MPTQPAKDRAAAEKPATTRPATPKPAAAKPSGKKPASKRATKVAAAAKRADSKPATAKRVNGKPATTARATRAAPATAAPAVTSRRTPSSDGFAAGAARASGERARRTRTPLIDAGPAEPPTTGDGDVTGLAEREEPAPTSAVEPEVLASTSVVEPVEPVEPGEPDEPDERDEPGARTLAVTARHTAGKHRPTPSPRAPAPSAKVVAHSGGRTEARQQTRQATAGSSARRAARTLASPPDVGLPQPPDAFAAGVPAGSAHPGLEDIVGAAVAALRTIAASSGISSEEVEIRVARILAFVRRRLTGDFDVDEFGFDEDFTANLYLPLLRPLYRTWFRVEVRGIDNLPADGGGLVVANHSGTVAMDSLMTQVAVFDEHPGHRHLRMLGADLVFQTPVIAKVARKSGSTLAGNADTERLLAGGDLVGVWPEGFKGVGKPFSERYKLQRFGRGGFVSAAIRTRVPIIPCSIVGAEEIYPILGNMKTLARLMGAPYAPVTPTWPLLGPLGLIPLPSKWIIEFGVPVETKDLGAGAADDPMLVFDLTDQIRETIQQTLYSLLMQRRSAFF